MTDDWDPNVVLADIDAPGRIYGDDKGELVALVSAVDYQWALQWRWSPKWSRGGRKVYLRRNVQIGPRATRVQKTLFLHQAIIARTGLIPPSPEHTLVEHLDGDGMNCQRENLCWITPSGNAHSAKRPVKYYHMRTK